MGRSQGGCTFTGVREWYNSSGEREGMDLVKQGVAFLGQDDSSAPALLGRERWRPQRMRGGPW